ncbi:MAG: hypothetical protein WD768_08910 [Phycisphaeraceae bacterium]
MHTVLLVALLVSTIVPAATARGDEAANARKPAGETDLRAWLENMIWHHHFTDEEVRTATGLSLEEIATAKAKLKIRDDTRPDFTRKASEPLRIVPYPGGRHPRIGFLDGAVDPQRESKISVFTPWIPAGDDKDKPSYVVIDLPEAVWSNLGLTYLAHTHVPTVWSKQKIDMKRLEWTRDKDGNLSLRRELPNGIAFISTAKPTKDAVLLKMTLTNGTDKTLTDLRVQMCVMLKGAPGFNQLTNDNKLLRKPFVAVHDDKKERWIISAWEPCHRPWANPPVPCLHSDPKFPDLKPGETGTLHGWLSFYEGKDIDAELKRIEGAWKR